jgi:hypothetical protein
MSFFLLIDYAARLFTVVGRTIYHPAVKKSFLGALPIAAAVVALKIIIAFLRNNIGGQAGYWFLESGA